MSDFTAIRAVSQTLKEILEKHITNNSAPQLNGVKIDLRTPKEMKQSNVLGISLWLYRVVRNGDLLNHPPERPAPNMAAHRSLPIDLYYLVTPIRTDAESEQALLGRILQVFNDYTIVRGSDLKDTLEGSTQELRLILEAPPLEELTRIWNSLQEPYQLSVTYMVQLVTIDSDLEPIQVSPVLTKETHYQQILAVR